MGAGPCKSAVGPSNRDLEARASFDLTAPLCAAGHGPAACSITGENLGPCVDQPDGIVWGFTLGEPAKLVHESAGEIPHSRTPVAEGKRMNRVAFRVRQPGSVSL